MTKKIDYKLVNRDRLFYDKYEYCAAFTLAEANALDELDHVHIDYILRRRDEWRHDYQHQWSSVYTSGTTLTADIDHFLNRWAPITKETYRDLHNIADFLLLQKADYRLVTTSNTGRIYTNDPDFVKKINKRPELHDKVFTRAHVTRPRGTIALKKPIHTHRSYFKYTALTQAEKDRISKFLQLNAESIRPSPSVSWWLTKHGFALQDHWFIDHDGDSWLMMLSLIKPGIVRKTLDIIQA